MKAIGVLVLAWLPTCELSRASTEAGSGVASVASVVSAASSGASVPSAGAPPLETRGNEATLPPLRGDAWIEALPLPHGGEAHVALPLGTTRRMPVIVGVHGAGDRPEWSCSEWLATTHGAAFVVCPHGVPDARWPGTRVWYSGAHIARESARAVSALRARYGAYVDDGPLVYASWSQGSTLAAAAIDAANSGASDAGDAPIRFARAILVEGGHTPIDATSAIAMMKARGMERVVVSCSSAKCRAFANDARAAAKRVDLPLHVVDVGDRGHWFDEPVFVAIGKELPWLTEGDPRFHLGE